MADIGYAPQAIIINGTTLTGIQSYTLDRREAALSLGADGVLHQTFHAIRRAAPRMDFTTVAAEALAGILGNTDAPMVKLTSNLDAFWAAQDADKPGLASSGHKGLRAAAGHVYLTGLRWSGGGGSGLEAAASAFFTSSDGTTNPLANITTPTLPTAAATEVLTLTACTLGGQTLGRVSSLDITIDPKAENSADMCYANGLPYPTLMQTAGVGGPIDIGATLETLDQVVTPTDTGTLVAVFTKYAQGGLISADTLTVTLANAMIREETRTAQQGNPSARRFRLWCRLDGVTKPITIAA